MADISGVCCWRRKAGRKRDGGQQLCRERESVIRVVIHVTCRQHTCHAAPASLHNKLGNARSQTHDSWQCLALSGPFLRVANLLRYFSPCTPPHDTVSRGTDFYIGLTSQIQRRIRLEPSVANDFTEQMFDPHGSMKLKGLEPVR